MLIFAWPWPVYGKVTYRKNARTLDFMENFEDLKAWQFVQTAVLMSTWWCVSTRGQGCSLIFDPVLSYFENFQHLLKSHWASFNQISCEASMAKGMKTYSDGQGYKTNMAAIPLYSEILWNFLLQNQFTQCLKIVYCIVYLKTTTLIQMMTLDWTWPFYVKFQYNKMQKHQISWIQYMILA